MHLIRSASLCLSAAISPHDLESAATVLEPPPLSANASSAGSIGIVHSYAFMAGELAEMKEGKTMRMETKLPIVTVVGAAALLLAVLAVVIAPRSQDSLRPKPE